MRSACASRYSSMASRMRSTVKRQNPRDTKQRKLKRYFPHLRSRAYKANKIRIWGAIDFHEIYKIPLVKGASPATNFHKHNPYELLLSESDSYNFLEANFPRLNQFKDQEIKRIIVDWSVGYLHT